MCGFLYVSCTGLRALPASPALRLLYESVSVLDMNVGGACNGITEAISRLSNSERSGNLVLILDNPDLLLASADATAHQLDLFMLKLRSQVRSTILNCLADQPLLQLRDTPIEIEGSRFLAQQAHSAQVVLSVGELATGAARDVSGVLRVSRSSSAYALDEDAVNSGNIICI